MFGTDWYYRYRYDGGIKSFWSWLQTNYRLNSLNLGDAWWTLTLVSRQDIGRRIITAYCAAGPGKLRIRDKSTSPWFPAACLGRAILQLALIGDMGRHSDLWLAEWDCWGQARSYFPSAPQLVKLPTSCVSVICVEKNHYHAVCGLQINKDITKISSWMFFSGRSGVLPVDGSNGQIPRGSTVSLHSVDPAYVHYTTVSHGPAYPDGTTIMVEFHIP